MVRLAQDAFTLVGEVALETARRIPYEIGPVDPTKAALAILDPGQNIVDVVEEFCQLHPSRVQHLGYTIVPHEQSPVSLPLA